MPEVAKVGSCHARAREEMPRNAAIAATLGARRAACRRPRHEMAAGRGLRVIRERKSRQPRCRTANSEWQEWVES